MRKAEEIDELFNQLKKRVESGTGIEFIVRRI